METKQIDLLDLFAAHALQGLLTVRLPWEQSAVDVASKAYTYAQAMLEERKKWVKDNE